MKTLLLLRHAKPEPPGNDKQDMDRDLLESGRNSASQTGESLKNKGYIPDIVFTSPALRARKTAHIAATHAAYGGEVLQIESLYNASVELFLSILAHPERLLPAPGQNASEAGTIMIVGHNPAIEDFVSEMSRQHLDIHAGDLVILNFDVDRWDDVHKSIPADIAEIIRGF
jgi:phosphohistidine phosphatase